MIVSNGTLLLRGSILRCHVSVWGCITVLEKRHLILINIGWGSHAFTHRILSIFKWDATLPCFQDGITNPKNLVVTSYHHLKCITVKFLIIPNIQSETTINKTELETKKP